MGRGAPEAPRTGGPCCAGEDEPSVKGRTETAAGEGDSVGFAGEADARVAQQAFVVGPIPRFTALYFEEEMSEDGAKSSLGAPGDRSVDGVGPEDRASLWLQAGEPASPSNGYDRDPFLLASATPPEKPLSQEEILEYVEDARCIARQQRATYQVNEWLSLGGTFRTFFSRWKSLKVQAGPFTKSYGVLPFFLLLCLVGIFKAAWVS